MCQHQCILLAVETRIWRYLSQCEYLTANMRGFTLLRFAQGYWRQPVHWKHWGPREAYPANISVSPDGLARSVNTSAYCFAVRNTHLEMFVSVRTLIYYLLICAGLRSHNSLRYIFSNQLTGSVEALGKLTKIKHLCVRMGYGDMLTCCFALRNVTFGAVLSPSEHTH